MGRGWWQAAAAIGALAIASCASEPEASTPTIELTTTTITTLPSTTEPPTTTEAPTTTEDPRIAEVEAAVAAARQLQVEVLLDPAIPVERLEAVLVGRALESVTESVLMLRADGVTASGAFSGSPVSTTLGADSATHVQCGLDAVAGSDASGVVVAPDESAFLLRYELTRTVDDMWRVELVRFEGQERTLCEL